MVVKFIYSQKLTRILKIFQICFSTQQIGNEQGELVVGHVDLVHAHDLLRDHHLHLDAHGPPDPVPGVLHVARLDEKELAIDAEFAQKHAIQLKVVVLDQRLEIRLTQSTKTLQLRAVLEHELHSVRYVLANEGPHVAQLHVVIEKLFEAVAEQLVVSVVVLTQHVHELDVEFVRALANPAHQLVIEIAVDNVLDRGHEDVEEGERGGVARQRDDGRCFGAAAAAAPATTTARAAQAVARAQADHVCRAAHFYVFCRHAHFATFSPSALFALAIFGSEGTISAILTRVRLVFRLTSIEKTFASFARNHAVVGTSSHVFADSASRKRNVGTSRAYRHGLRVMIHFFL